MSIKYSDIPADKKIRGRTKRFFQQIEGSVGTESDEQLAKMVKDGIDVRAEVEGGTPLHKAVKNNCCEVIKALLDKGVDVNYRGSGDVWLLYTAITHNQIEPARLLLEGGINHLILINGNPPLAYALELGLKEFVRLFIDFRIDPEIIYWSRLHVACMQGDVEKVREFIADGDNINAVSDSCNGVGPGDFGVMGRLTPLKVAAVYDHPEIIKLLMNNGAVMDDCSRGLSTVHLAAKYGSVAAIYELGHQGFDFNYREENNYTPLHHVVDENENEHCGDPTAVVRALVANGANINLVSGPQKQTPLIRAMLNMETPYQFRLVHALTECGANIYVQDYEKSLEPIADEWVRVHIKSLKDCYRRFYTDRFPPRGVEEVYKLLAAMPSEREGQEIDPVENLRKILLYSEWDSREQALRMMERLQRWGFKVEITEVMEKVAVLRRWVDFGRDDKRGTMGRGV